MNWFYADNGQQRGPVSETEFDSLVVSGAIQPSTLVWCEGMAAWKPFSEVRTAVPPPAGGPPAIPINGGAASSVSPAAGMVTCSVCGKGFTEDQVIRFGPTIVCGGCKPVFLQRLREGASTSAVGSGGTLSTAELLALDYEVDISGDLGRSWDVFKADAGLIIGASFLVVLAHLVAVIPAFIVFFIPFAPHIILASAQGILLGGLWHFYIRKARGEKVGVGDAFSGFGPRALHLALSLVIPLIALLAVVVVAGMLMFGIFGLSGIGARPTTPGQEAVFGLIGIGMFLGIIGVVLVVTIGMLFWFFTIPLVIDKGLKFWPAMELSRKMMAKHFFMMLLYFFLCWLLMNLGYLVCIVGMLVTGPWVFGALAQHYNRVFGQLRQGG